jgi:hypothetical protein
MGTIGSFQVFTSVYMMTHGGPNYSTSVVVYYRLRQPPPAFDLRHARVVDVAAEQFVPPIARQCHRDVLPGQPGDEIRRNLRRVREGLVVDLREERHNGLRLALRRGTVVYDGVTLPQNNKSSY